VAQLAFPLDVKPREDFKTLMRHLANRFRAGFSKNEQGIVFQPNRKLIRQKATRDLNRRASCETAPVTLQRFHLGAHSVLLEVSVWCVMELPTVQTKADFPSRSP
jgi:hypothetical protein